jgi:predicted TIM-barrel fold metal-dependent hydrolase
MAVADPVHRDLDSRVPMVDTHHHLWDLRRYRYDWLAASGRADVTEVLGDYSGIRRDYGIDQLIAEYEAVGIVKSVHVQADISEPDPVVETAWLQAIADVHGFPHAIVAHSDLCSPNVEFELDRHQEYANVRGIRMFDDDDLFADPSLRRRAQALVARELSLELDTPPSRMAPLARLAHDLPSLRLFLGHTGFPENRSSSYFEQWRRTLRKVARADNVAVKISGLGMGDHGWTAASIRPWVLEAIDIFGVDRCVFGTNWPVDRLYSDLPTLTDAYRGLVSGFNLAEQEALLFRNAERLYSI